MILVTGEIEKLKMNIQKHLLQILRRESKYFPGYSYFLIQENAKTLRDVIRIKEKTKIRYNKFLSRQLRNKYY